MILSGEETRKTTYFFSLSTPNKLKLKLDNIIIKLDSITTRKKLVFPRTK